MNAGDFWQAIGDKNTHAVALHHLNSWPWAAAERRGLRVYLHGLQHGALLRPLGDVVYFMPPYVVTAQEIDQLVDVAIGGIERAVRG